jgi:hypothetical protein
MMNRMFESTLLKIVGAIALIGACQFESAESSEFETELAIAAATADLEESDRNGSDDEHTLSDGDLAWCDDGTCGHKNPSECREGENHCRAHDMEAYVNYCQRRLLREEGGLLFCNWGRSFAHACTITFPISFIHKGSVISGPTGVGNCSGTGVQVVKVTHN